jgi:broad specificity phosphatase PhoE
MILIRHGESEFNAAVNRTGKSPGIPDPKLTPLGHEQVRRTAEDVRRHHRPIRRLISSPFTRALQTATIIAEALELPVEVELIVHEHACYDCDIGTPISRLAQSWPALDFTHIPEIWWPEMEPREDMLKRCADFRTKAAMFSDWEHVAVVSHWGFIRGLTGHDARNAEIVPFDPTRQ